MEIGSIKKSKCKEFTTPFYVCFIAFCFSSSLSLKSLWVVVRDGVGSASFSIMPGKL